MNSLNGKIVATNLQHHLRQQAQQLPPLTLGVVLVGENPASVSYIKRKQKFADGIGVGVQLQQLPTDATQDQVMAAIDRWNYDPAITGQIVQLPLPPHLDQSAILAAIDPIKDVDGLHPVSLGKLVEGHPQFVPATARGVLELLQHYQVPLSGQQVAVVGRSLLVGKPIALLLLAHNATVTIAHRQTQDLAAVTQTADVLVVAAGHPGLITDQHLKPGAVIVDVGITPTPDGPRGDVDASAQHLAAAISPVPGGVGPLTVACLFQNLLDAYYLQSGINSISL